MKKATPRRILSIVLVLVLLGSLAALGYQAFQYREGEEIYSEAEELVQLPDLDRIEEAPSGADTSYVVPDASNTADTSAGSAAPSETENAPVYVDPYAEALQSMDFTALRKKNKDVLGWILIPNTVISYPLVQGEDNDYYLSHTWRKSRNVVGAIFMDWQCSADLSDFNTIIYGHRMNNQTMFAKLLNYKKQSYLNNHPRFYITDDNGTHTYEIFAAYEVEVKAPTYCIAFSSEAERQSFIDFCVEQSVVDTGVIPTVNDRIVTLSTCTGNGHATRWVVQGVERVETGTAPSEEAPAEPSASEAAETAPAETQQPESAAAAPAGEGTAGGAEPAAPEQKEATGNG